MREAWPRAERPLSAATATHRQALLAVQPMELLEVHAPSLTPRHLSQSPVPEPAALSSERAQKLAIRCIILEDFLELRKAGLTRPVMDENENGSLQRGHRPFLLRL
jgi:hypothetical protein